MRLAKKLGLLGALVALVAGIGIFARGATPVSADRTVANCVDAANESCVFTTLITVVGGGTMTLQDITAGTSIIGLGTVGGGFFGPCPATGIPGTFVTVTCPFATPINAGTAVTILFNNPAAVPIQLIVTYNANGGGAGTFPGVCGTAPNAGSVVQCINATIQPAGIAGTYTLTVNAPAGATVQVNAAGNTLPAGCSFTTPLPTPVPPAGFAVVTVSCTASIGANPIFTLSVTVSAPGGTPTESTATPAAFIPPPNTETITFTLPAGPPPTGGATKQCSTANGLPPLGGTVVTCTVQTNGSIPVGGSLQITPPAGSTSISCTTAGAPAGSTTATFAGGNCIFANNTLAPIPAGAIVGTEIFTVAAGAAAGTILTEQASLCSNAVAPCVLVVGTVVTTAICNGVGCQVGTVVPPVVSNQPTDENKFCTNTVTQGTLVQTIGASNQVLSVTGPAKTFTLPLIGPASTCIIQVDKGTAGGVATPCSVANPCADGNIMVTATTNGAGGVIACAAGANPVGQVLPVVSNGGGACTQQNVTTQLNEPCGVTAGTAAANTTVSATCTGVTFDIQSAIGACISNPTNTVGVCPNLGANLTATTMTLTIQFIATPANGGSVGGIQLGQNVFNFQAPGTGVLLVTATPQLIPSNGTLASVITATFACGTGFSLINGFPLSSTGFGATTGASNGPVLNQPLLGGIPSQNALCGAGLAGTFNFATPGPVLFDNGRSTEAIPCGLSGQNNLFGGVNPFNPLGLNPTAPLAFTCSGAAVLAIGAGAAGDAPINVTYTSGLGGLVAIGSTFITVSPSGTPRISVSCNPSSISGGNTGSICTATVTDINGTPLTGSTGATVTWTTSDTSTTTILPCVVQVTSAINITTSPNIVPQIVPNVPCLTPSGTIPGQSNTFINGQTTALLTASNYSHPETVTVSATLGVLVPPSYACQVAPYLPTAFGGINSGNTATSGVGLPSVVGCGQGNPIGFTGIASGFSTSQIGLTGIVTLPNATSASTTVAIGGPAGILIASATNTSPLLLSRGCNQVIATMTIGTPIANLAALVSPAAAVVSVWRFSNGTKQFQAGFFSDPAAPTDFLSSGAVGTTTASSASGLYTGGVAGATGTQGNVVTETYYVCVNQNASIVPG